MHSNDVAKDLVDLSVRLLLTTKVQILHPETQISMEFFCRSIEDLEDPSVAILLANLDT